MPNNSRQMSKIKYVSIATAGLVLCCAGCWALFHHLEPAADAARLSPPVMVLAPQHYEAWARQHFFTRHSGDKPLNWKLAEKAAEFYENQPMGKFVLQENDCSDFVDCIVDEALGYGARFNRDSDSHVAARTRGIWQSFYWDGQMPLLPGDILSVRHSPWYHPDPESCWHVGIIGADGKVYDFVKLKSWSAARYGRKSVEWFIRHSNGPRQLRVWRLHPRYRYCVSPLPGLAG